MTRLRLNPVALVVPTAGGVVLRSPRGTFELKGRDAPVFLNTLAPLLDGSRTASAIADAVPAYSRASVLAFLDLLERRGLIEPVPEVGESLAPPASVAATFLRPVEAWSAEAPARLASRRVLIVGAAPWGAVAAEALNRAGVGTLQRLYDDVAVDNDALILPDGPWNLILGATGADDLWLLYRLARAANLAGVPSLTATLDGHTALLGPAVVPGHDACWNCCRLRQLANARHREANHALQAALLAARPPVQPPAYLAPAAAQLGQLLALEALKLLAGAPESALRGCLLVQDLLTLETHLHTVIRMPWCPVCGGAAASDPSEATTPPASPLDPTADPDELRAGLAGWVDARTGVIRRLTMLPPADGEPDLPVVAMAVTGVYTEGAYTTQEPLYASGKGRSATEALIGAVGEAVERYSATRFCRADLVRCATAALQDDFVDARDLALFSAAQYATPGFPYRPVDPDQPLDWVRGHWLDTGASVWVPALAAYLHFPAPPAEYFCPITSNGLAAGMDFDDAARRAVWELIERDAFIISWLARLPGQPVVLDTSLPAEAGEVIRQLATRGVAVELYRADAGLDIPVLVALALGDGQDWPGLVVGLAAHPDPCVAARKAIFEAAAVAPHIRRQMHAGDPPIPATPAAVRTLDDHALYYAPAGRVALADPFRQGGTPVALGDLAEAGDNSLAACAEQLRARGVRVALVDVTAPDVYAHPFRVVRAVGAGMQPIRFGHNLQALATPRLLARLTRGLHPHPHPVA